MIGAGRGVHTRGDREPASQSKAANRLNPAVGEGSPAVEHRQPTAKCCTTPSPHPSPASSRRHRLLGRPLLSGVVRPESAWAMATPDLGQGDKSKIHWRAAARGERESERQGGGA